jgi:hypothetical protein
MIDLDYLKQDAQLCYIAYKPGAIAAFEALGYAAEVLGQSSPIEQVYLLRLNDELTFVICGSNDMGDWWCNFSAPPKAFLHVGYSQAATEMLEPVKRAIISSGCSKVRFIGHSKGGAVAAILGYYLGYLNPEVVSFGAPRIGNVRLAQIYRPRYTRVVNAWDIVARLPSHSMGYRHCGDPVVLDGGKFVEGVAAWETAQRNYPTALLMLRLWRSVMAHFSYWQV